MAAPAPFLDLGPALAAAGDANKATRDAAEVALKQLENDNTALFLSSLSRVLADASKPPGMRQLAGIMMKNALWNADDNIKAKFAERWEKIDVAVRNEVKGIVLSALGADDLLARSAAAQVVAKIGGIDIAAGEWADLVPSLLGHANNPALPVTALHAVLMTIGYLLEEIDPSAITPAQIEQILGSFVVGMGADRPVDIQQVAATAMVAALPFASDSFTDAKSAQRDLIMSAICNATLVPDEKVRLAAFDCIILVASLYYNNIQPYMTALFNITTASVQKEEAIAIRSIEFWNTVCEVEITLVNEERAADSKGYARGAVNVLVPLMTSCMVKQPDAYDETVTLSMAASLCLGLVAQATGDACLNLVAEFLTTAFGSPDWHFREAASMAIGSVMEGPSDAALKPFITHFTPLMIDRLVKTGAESFAEPHVSVRDTTAWALAKIVLNHVKEVDPVQLSRLVDVLTASLSDEPRVVVNVCYCINVLSSTLAEEGMHSGLSARFPALFKALGDAQARDDWDESNMRDSCWLAIGELLKNSTDADMPFVQVMLGHTISMLDASVAKPLATADDRIEQFSLQSCLCGALQVIINRMEAAVVPTADAIMGSLLRLLALEGTTAVEDALMAISALANHASERFPAYLDSIHPFLLSTLKEHENFSICVAASVALGDISRAVGPLILKYSDLYMNTVVQNLINPELNSVVKPPLLSSFGDVAMAVGPEFKRYIVYCFQLLTQAAAMEMDPDDEDEVEFVSEIRIAVLEAYTGIVQGFVNNNPELGLMLVPQLPEIAKFAMKIAGEIQASGDDSIYEGKTPTIIKLLVGVLGDITSSVDKRTWFGHFNTSLPWVQALLNWLNTLETAEETPADMSVAQWAMTALKP